MRWQAAKLFTGQQIGEDQLGNAVVERQPLCDLTVRSSPWTKEEIVLLGRDVTTSQRKFLTLRPLEQILTAKYLGIGENIYDIEAVSDIGRYRLLTVKGWRI
ncbi:hypothetical protein [Eubacterium aggregans]|uniref:hypothetical protein n=1 Tax=Eubacterium aggregans TaxID=81409 RepID=UPI003F355C06